MSIEKKASLLSGLIAAGYLATACSPINNTPAPDLSEDDQNIVENTGETGQAMPVVIMDPRKKGKAPLHSKIAGSRDVKIKPLFNTTPKQGKREETTEYKEETTYTEQDVSDEVLVMGMSVDTTKNSKHRYFTALQQIKGIDHLNDAQLGQTLDGNSAGAEWSMIARNYAGVFSDLARGARDINGIHVDSQMGNAAEKTANAYDYWAKHWTADITNNVLTGGSTTIGDITSSSNSDAYADAYSNAYSNSSLENNLETINSLEFNPNINNILEFNPEIINSSEINQEMINSQEGASTTPQQGSGCDIRGKRTSSLYTSGPSRTVYAVSAKGIDTSGEGRYPRNGRLVFALS